jgi:hypothetical protein
MPLCAMTKADRSLGSGLSTEDRFQVNKLAGEGTVEIRQAADILMCGRQLVNRLLHQSALAAPN